MNDQNGYGDCQLKPPKSVTEEASKDKAKKNAIFTNKGLLALVENCCLPVTDVCIWVEHVNDIVSRRKKLQSAPATKQPSKKVIYVQFYVDVFNYLFYVINVVVSWADA